MLNDLSLKTILNNLTMGIAILDKNRKFIYINDLTTKITGYTLADIKNLDVAFKLAFPNFEKRNEVRENFKNKIAKGKHYNQVINIRTKNNKNKFIEFRVNPLENGYLLVNLMDVSKRVEQEAEIKYLSYHDGLTNLYNRRYFEAEMERMNHSRNYPISIIIGDLDNLKIINDTYGHLNGDQYLKKSAEILKKTLRTEDIIARIGGDEFAVLLPKTGTKAAKIICKRIINQFKNYNSENKYLNDFKISLGFATAAAIKKDLFEIYNQADKNMYKNKGR
ncbi:sensor domain-containing diguanylate cyclase [Halanaerobium praevalens]|uniref:Diguanylate cyclase with PAS/PAC sensor n=1 Tax=Halanaerobium praevalens (strain ATCC 33744 / DSM 2228 / GSL) TaxID=572479 RepID=E3DLR4_HALPG|nr:sensor domain-containing diguanylate cyclase [Halanaerobium praevalens]ADO77261.1 diguanylate cyclase with PAS/PAC sensor [Halanaerobium praevalens DSM 2228]